jgi:hypothetical protein
VQIAIDWAQKEGWNLGLYDAKCFYKADPNGFFIGLLDNEPIAVGAAINYSEQFSFLGLYIVKPEFRKQGYGLQLALKRLDYVGNRITGLDSVPVQAPINERLGYVVAHKQIRYECTNYPTACHSTHIVDLNTIPFKQLEEFDRAHFLVPRSEFLRSWTQQDHGHALGYLSNGKLGGYGVIRKCPRGYKIGPLFATNPSIAEQLFEALCAKVSEGPIYLDTPEPNKNAQLLAKHYQMTPKFEMIRMYRNGALNLNLDSVYGVTTFELG